MSAHELLYKVLYSSFLLGLFLQGLTALTVIPRFVADAAFLPGAGRIFAARFLLFAQIAPSLHTEDEKNILQSKV